MQHIHKLEQLINKSLVEIDADFEENAERTRLLYVSLKQQKGVIGNWFEWILTGKRGDNLAEADDTETGVEIKCCQFIYNNGTWQPKENLRLTTINYNEIQYTAFEDSCLVKKSKILIARLSYNTDQTGANVKLIDIGYINLLDERWVTQVKADYQHVREMCMMGMADKLTSKKDQSGKIIKTYSHGNGKNVKTYTDAAGNQQQAKGKAFYLFKQQQVDLFQSILDN